jgi:hypothetical protein
MRLKFLLKRLVDKIVKDALPAGLASILGGLLLTHFQLDRVPQPTTVKVTQASPEMMQLLRDEHGLIIDFVKEQVASEKNRGGADQSAQRAAAEASAPPAAEVAPSPPVQRPIPVVALAAPKPAAPRSAARTRLSVLRCRRPRLRKLSRPIRCLRRRRGRMIRFSPRRSGSRTSWSPSPSARYRRPSASFRLGSARSATASAGRGSPRARRRTWSVRLGSCRARRTDSGRVTAAVDTRIRHALLFRNRSLAKGSVPLPRCLRVDRAEQEAARRLPPRRRI